MFASIAICRLIPSQHHNLTSHLIIGSIHQIRSSDLIVRSIHQILAYNIHTKYTQNIKYCAQVECIRLAHLPCLPAAGRVCSTCVNFSSQVEYIRLALIYFIVCHTQVECIRPAYIILRRSSVFDLRTFISPSATRRSSVFDLRHLFFAGRVCWACALFSLLLHLGFIIHIISYLFSLLYNNLLHVLTQILIFKIY